MKYLSTIAISLISLACFAQQKPNQYILIIRSKTPVTATAEAIKSNIDHWTSWMTDLGKSGKIAGGYRPSAEGITLSKGGKTIKSSPYISEGHTVSSVLIIYAVDLSEAKQIASRCPVFELDGNVEIRTIQNTAN